MPGKAYKAPHSTPERNRKARQLHELRLQEADIRTLRRSGMLDRRIARVRIARKSVSEMAREIREIDRETAQLESVQHIGERFENATIRIKKRALTLKVAVAGIIEDLNWIEKYLSESQIAGFEISEKLAKFKADNKKTRITLALFSQALEKRSKGGRIKSAAAEKHLLV